MGYFLMLSLCLETQYNASETKDKGKCFHDAERTVYCYLRSLYRQQISIGTVCSVSIEPFFFFIVTFILKSAFHNTV